MPKSLRVRVVDIAHGGHQGIAKTKALIRTRVRFPGIDKAVQEAVKTCKLCQAVQPRQNFQPLKASAMPEAPMPEVSADFFGPLDDKQYWLVVMDDHSRKPFVLTVKSTSAYHTLPALEQLFSTVGIPSVLKTDNGAPFQSSHMKEFAGRLGFTHRRVTPAWPRANGEVERFMQNLGHVVRLAKLRRADKQECLCAFLRAYGETPHATTKAAPNLLFFGFSRTCGLPDQIGGS